MDFLEFLGRFFKDGGFFMYPITFLLAFGIAVVIERFYVLFKKFNLDGSKYYNFVEQKLLAKELDAAIKGSPDVPLSNIVRFGLEMLKKVDKLSIEQENKIIKGERRFAVLFEKNIEEISSLEFPKIDRRLNLLPTIANLATLLGLLGTLQGLIKSFTAVSGLDPAQRAQVLAKGISVAMNTTAYGLFVAVFVLFMYAILNNRAERLKDMTEYYVLKFINFVTMRY
ncbi:MAG: MotA/TolQ/ExbB proton channel family protein [Proteobacteria bacterium]|nr:MotA/TolQ/ExbB proton channel family protein [Pseudomonadota bacterium]